MCGIFFSLSPCPDAKPNAYLRHALWARGPDCMGSHRVSLDIHWPFKPDTPTKQPLRTHIYFVSTLLSLRGNGIASQPLVDPSTGCCFAWNGEAWKVGSDEVDGNDTLAVFSLLLQSILNSTKLNTPNSEREAVTQTAFVRALGCIVGPFSFVFYDAVYQRVFFGRDRIGRRSLMVRRGSVGDVTISSVSDEEGDWVEVKADGIYELDLKNPDVRDKAVAVNNRTPLSSILGLLRLPWTNYWLLSKAGSTNATGYSRNIKHEYTSLAPLNRNTENTENWRLNLQSESVYQLECYLKSSLRLRAQTISNNDPEHSPREVAKVAVLFSGGVDCTVIARIVHDLLPHHLEVDLLNVAFENPRSVAAAAIAAAKNGSDVTTGNPYARCPDRITGVSSYAELQKACPNRLWRFVSLNISYAEMVAHRDKVISLMYPHNTEMDLSIACALYFAARGQGIATAQGAIPQSYTTSARVLLSGLGADELFAGYTRHATAFHRRGYCGLLDELDLDLNRLSERNLGRDDRIISHWGKEVRYPYLDENLVNWAVALPLWEKCGFGQGGIFARDLRIEESKTILRILACKLDMPGVAIERKRAIQFGSRTAKMTVGRTKGTEVVE